MLIFRQNKNLVFQLPLVKTTICFTLDSSHTFQNMLKMHAGYTSEKNDVFLVVLLLFDCQSKLCIFKSNLMCTFL